MNKPIVIEAKITDCKFGFNVKILSPSNIYGAELGDDVFIGPFVEIQKGVKIGARTKVQSHSFICELVTIGDDCFIGHGAKFVNDLFKLGGPAGGDKSLWASTLINNNVSIGTNATILPVNICGGTVIGAGSVVVNNIEIPGVYVGNPAKLIRKL
ncbi:N-acetyltransferase [Alphaproteobacteria bacterium]|nr:N-acetyltransferase [Alphaproteobacteria bacterium]